MKKTQIIDILTTIKRSRIPFISILMFVLLSVGIFTGISWSAVSVEESTEQYVEELHLHDAAVYAPYGMTQEDLDKISEVEGVDEIEGSRLTYETMSDVNNSYLFQVAQLTTSIDIVKVTEGTLPAQEGEIAIEENTAEHLGLKVGDTISFMSEEDNYSRTLVKILNFDTDQDELSDLETDSDSSYSMNYLKTDTFKVTAIVEDPNVTMKSESFFGNAVTTGKQLQGYAYVAEASMDETAFDGWNYVLIRNNSLHGYLSTSQEYEDLSDAFSKKVEAVTDQLATQKYQLISSKIEEIKASGDSKLADSAEQISEAEKKISDGETTLAEKKQELADKEKELSDGQAAYDDGARQLESGKAQLDAAAATIADGEAQISSAEATLAEKQAELDSGAAALAEGKAQLDEKKPVLDQALATLTEKQALFDEATTIYSKVADIVKKTEDSIDAGEFSLEEAIDYIDKSGVVEDIRAFIEKHSSELSDMVPMVQSLIQELEKKEYDSVRDLLNECNNIINGKINDARTQLDSGWAEYNSGKAQYDAGLQTYNEKMQQWESGRAQIEEARATLAAKKAELEAGKQTYQENLALYEQKKAELEAAAQKLKDGAALIADGKVKLADGEKELEESKQKLADGKQKYADGEKSLDKFKEKTEDLKDVGSFLFTRKYHVGIQSCKTIISILRSVRYSLAGLFVIVGLLVCYFAVQRIVTSHIRLIGTQKALGFSRREIAVKYLLFTGISVLAGCLLGRILGQFLVEPIISSGLTNSLALDSFISSSEPEDFLIMSAFEIGLLLLISWLAIASLLRKNAVELLAGEKPPVGKKHFYENFFLFKKLSLFGKTIVNNFFTEKKRVFGTFVGIAGCTSLLVTAFTMNDNILGSFDKQYKDYYHFDTMLSFDENDEGTAEGIEAILKEKGLSYTELSSVSVVIKLQDDKQAAGFIMVPLEEESFREMVNFEAAGGETADPYQGAWLNHAISNEVGSSAGNTIQVTDFSGKKVEVTLTGYYLNYVNPTVIYMDQETYRNYYGEAPSGNTYYVNSNGIDLQDLSELFLDRGLDVRVQDFKEDTESVFNTFRSMSMAMIGIFAFLSVMLGLLVLLNLLTMFVEEKKKELIVLLINGFSVKDARKYISGDTVVLTVLGIIGGIVLGCVIGDFAVKSFDTVKTCFMRQLDPFAILLGIGGTAVISFIMCQIALRRISRFKMADINN